MSWFPRLRDLLRGPASIDVFISCDAAGITLALSNSTTQLIAWQNITHLIAYKKDCVTAEQIRLIISSTTFATEVTENDLGFDSLIPAIREHLPASLPGWHQHLKTAPAFDTSITHVYPPQPQA